MQFENSNRFLKKLLLIVTPINTAFYENKAKVFKIIAIRWSRFVYGLKVIKFAERVFLFYYLLITILSIMIPKTKNNIFIFIFKICCVGHISIFHIFWKFN